jgi:peptidoglycan/xylan/chitin deacetylase (PgdA/CDA1 family)
VRRPPLIWPNAARVALLVIPNVEFFALSDAIVGGGTPPDVPAWSVRDYGNRVGIFRLMEVLDRYAVRGTAALNGEICTQHPEIVAEGCARSWEWMGHNMTNARRLTAVPADEERALIRLTLDTIAAGTGARPAGWLGAGLAETWNTLGHLAAEGVEYVCDWVNDDQPYLMQLEDGRSLVAIAYEHDIDDKVAYERRNVTSHEFRDMIVRQFDVLYREGARSGRCMAIAVHPYLSGAAHRIGALDAALEHICSHDGVWLATGAEVARYLRERSAAFAAST